MTTPNFPSLRALMGGDWVEVNVLSADSEHPLGIWFRKKDGNPWLHYTDELLGQVLHNDRFICDRVALARKLAGEYLSTLPELEAAARLLQAGCVVTMEPTAPAKGPDIQAGIDGQSYFVEVRAVGDSQDDDRFNTVSSEFFARLNELPSRFTVNIVVGDRNKGGSGDLKKAIDAVIMAMAMIEKKGWQRATLYYSAVASLLNSDHSLNAEEQKIVDNAEVIVEFRDTGAVQERTRATAWRPIKTVPTQDQTHERLKKLLGKKKAQLPDGNRGVLLFEVSELFTLTDFSIESALYGDLVVRLTAPTVPGGPIGEPALFRNGRGFFGKSSRVSAVVFHTRTVVQGKVQSRWRVFPTNRADADTLLTERELMLFGDLENRKDLCAGNLPEAIANLPSPDVGIGDQ